MNFETHVYKLNEGAGVFAVSLTGTFDNAEQEKLIEKLPFHVSAITNIMWCVNAVGYVELFWGTEERICVLSGNGRWDLSTLGMDFSIPTNSEGRILLSTSGFDDLDSYTIVISGKLKK